jgi:FMN phosphatase YigB (HAD superfamily)
MRPRALLITDLDNTLYDFPAYYQAGLRAMVVRLGEALDIETNAVVEGLRSIYSSHHSIEYPFAIEEMPELRSVHENDRRDLIADALSCFWKEATAALSLYPTVLETLDELTRQGVPIIAYTDAPIHEAMRRIRCLEIDRYITGLVAQQWFRRRRRTTFVVPLRTVPGFMAPPRRFKIAWRVPYIDRKPNAAMYERIRCVFDIPAERVTVIGDSVPRDLAPAVQIGMRTVWARYGRRTGSADETLLMKVVPHRLPEVGARVVDDCASDFQVDSFREILEVMPVQQLLWFDPEP